MAANAHLKHRWNIDPQTDGSMLVCRGEHDKAEACRWERLVPERRLAESEAAAARMRQALEDRYLGGDDGIETCDLCGRGEINEVKHAATCPLHPSAGADLLKEVEALRRAKTEIGGCGTGLGGLGPAGVQV